MSVIGELVRYLDASIEALAQSADRALLDLLASARPVGDDDLPSSAERILDSLELHEVGRHEPPRVSSLSEEAQDALDRLEAICRIILGR